MAIAAASFVNLVVGGRALKVLNQTVKRNVLRFPESVRFQLKKEEYVNLKSPFVISKE